MRRTNGLIKQSGDIHPPELDDGFDDEGDEPRRESAAASSAPALQMRREPSLMPLLAMLGGVFLLYRLLR